MKLTKENFSKMKLKDDTIVYTYRCNDVNFFITTRGDGAGKEICVFKGALGKREAELKTDNSLAAWSYFEDLLKECEPAQNSSGGFAKKPQENPNILPLLAISENSNGFDVTLFALTEDKKQVKIFDFVLPAGAIPSAAFTNNTVNVVNWSALDLPQMLKCEVMLKAFPAVEYEEDKVKKVFLFIPKSITEQGGEKAGGEPSDEEGEEGEGKEGEGKEKGEKKDGKKGDKKDKKSKEKPSEGGEPADENDESGDGDEGDEGEDGEDKGDKKGKSKGKKGEGEDGDDSDGAEDEKDGEDKNKSMGDDDENAHKKEERDDEEEDGDGKRKKGEGKGGSGDDKSSSNSFDGNKRIDFSDAVTKISEIENLQPSKVISLFRNEGVGETFLATSDFDRIARELGAPKGTTPLDLAQIIINSKAKSNE